MQVDGAKLNAATDVMNAFDGGNLADIYRFNWRSGSDADVAKLATPGSALVEEQFAKQHGLSLGDRFELRTPAGRRARFTAVAEYRDPTIVQGVIVSPADFRRISVSSDPFAFWIRGDWVVGTLDQIVYLLYALFAMSLVIALFGIANSLFLSIHERTRELGMLRAIGATRSQIRQLIRYESIITAVIGGLVGTAIGILLAWLTTYALDDLGLGFAIPAGQLVAVGVLAVLAGVVGAIVPARRAAKLDILRAVASGD